MPGALSTKKSKTLFSRGSESGKERRHAKQQPTSDTTKRPAQKSRGHSAAGMRKAKGDRHFREGQACAKVQEPEETSRGKVSIWQTLPFDR